MAQKYAFDENDMLVGIYKDHILDVAEGNPNIALKKAIEEAYEIGRRDGIREAFSKKNNSTANFSFKNLEEIQWTVRSGGSPRAFGFRLQL